MTDRPTDGPLAGAGGPRDSAARFDLVIFDFDGTVADTWTWFQSELVAGAEEIGYRTVSDAKLEELRGRGTEAVLAAIGVTPTMLPALADRLRRRAEESVGEFRLFDGVPRLLKELHARGVTLAVVSSNSEQVVRKALGAELSALFTAGRFGAAVFDKAKAFEEILAETRCDPISAVAIGDETRDVDAARKANLRPIAVEWGFANAALLRSLAPGATVPDVDALRTLLIGNI